MVSVSRRAELAALRASDTFVEALVFVERIAEPSGMASGQHHRQLDQTAPLRAVLIAVDDRNRRAQ